MSDLGFKVAIKIHAVAFLNYCSLIYYPYVTTFRNIDSYQTVVNGAAPTVHT